MAVRRVSPEEARELIEKEGYVYVDVRSVPEFGAGHPAGAVNVPLLHASAFGMSPNHEFVEVSQVGLGTVQMSTRHEMLDVVVVDGKAKGIIARDLLQENWSAILVKPCSQYCCARRC